MSRHDVSFCNFVYAFNNIHEYLIEIRQNYKLSNRSKCLCESLARLYFIFIIKQFLIWKFFSTFGTNDHKSERHEQWPHSTNCYAWSPSVMQKWAKRKDASKKWNRSEAKFKRGTRRHILISVFTSTENEWIRISMMRRTSTATGGKAIHFVQKYRQKQL